MFFFLSVLALVYHVCLLISDIAWEVLKWIVESEHFLGLLLLSFVIYKLRKSSVKPAPKPEFIPQRRLNFSNEKSVAALVNSLPTNWTTTCVGFSKFVANILSKVNLHLVCWSRTYIYYLVCLMLAYFYILCFTSESGILLYINILKYFYSSLYLHVLFAYVFVLCCIYTVFTEYYGLVNIIRFISSIRWSWFFFTNEEIKTNKIKNPD
jgi:hypothetical protein